MMNPKEESQKKNLSQSQKKKENRSQLNDYIKYSGLAFQMVAVMGLAVWGGMHLDEASGNDFPVFMIVLSLLAFTATLILTIRSLPKD